MSSPCGKFIIHAVMRFLIESGTEDDVHLVGRRMGGNCSQAQKRVTGRQRGCIDHYLSRLVVDHLCKPTNNDKNRIITGALPTMSRYQEQLQVSIVFSSNEFSSLLGSQLSSDDFGNVE